jgi:hypothetical protein
MLESIITFLIYICILAIVIYAVLWVLRDVLGLPLPGKIIQILWVIFALVCLLFLVRLLLPLAGGHGKVLGFNTDIPSITQMSQTHVKAWQNKLAA